MRNCTLGQRKGFWFVLSGADGDFLRSCRVVWKKSARLLLTMDMPRQTTTQTEVYTFHCHIRYVNPPPREEGPPPLYLTIDFQSIVIEDRLLHSCLDRVRYLCQSTCFFIFLKQDTSHSTKDSITPMEGINHCILLDFFVTLIPMLDLQSSESNACQGKMIRSNTCLWRYVQLSLL